MNLSYGRDVYCENALRTKSLKLQVTDRNIFIAKLVERSSSGNIIYFRINEARPIANPWERGEESCIRMKQHENWKNSSDYDEEARDPSLSYLEKAGEHYRIDWQLEGSDVIDRTSILTYIAGCNDDSKIERKVISLDGEWFNCIPW